MNEPPAPDAAPREPPQRLSAARRLDAACAAFEDACRAGAGAGPCIEDHLAAADAAERPALLRELVLLDVFYRRRAGQRPTAADYRDRFPDFDPAWLDANGTPDPDAPTLVVGREVGGAAPVPPGYEFLGVLGRGGMGVVSQARDLKLKRVVAVKAILSGPHAGPDELARFRAEAESVARLQHPNIVQVFEVGEHHGLPFLALEHVGGGSLARRLSESPLGPAEAARLVQTLARAVQHAHERGVVHRDLKPANVLLTEDDTPKVTDFGLAKRLDGDGGQTASGALLGTPSYMAPEQAAGRGHTAGPASDVYALGAILYECLTGRPPFKGADVLDTLQQVRSQDPVPPGRLQPKVPRDLETVCLKCLRKEPRQRYGSALDLAEDLRRFLAGEPVRARPTPAWEQAWKWARRRPAVATSYALLFVVVGLGGLGSGAAWLWRSAEQAHASTAEALAGQEEANRQKDEALREKDKALLGEQAALRRLEDLSYLLDIDLAYRDWQQYRVVSAQKRLAGLPLRPRQWEWHYLDRLTRSARHEFEGRHARAVVGLAYAADGSTLYSASAEGEVKAWDATGREKHSFRIPVEELKRGPLHVALHPGAQLLAVSSPPAGVTLRRLGSGKLLRHLHDGDGKSETPLEFSPDGQLLAGGGGDGVTRVWDVATGQLRHELKGDGRPIRGVAFSADGKWVANATYANSRERGAGTRVWDLQTGALVRHLPQFNLTGKMAFSNDGKWLAVAESGGAIVLWDAASGQKLFEALTRDGPRVGLGGVAFAPNNGTLAFAGNARGAVFWDPPRGRELRVVETHEAVVVALAIHPDGTRLATGAEDGRLVVAAIRARDARDVRFADGNGEALALNPNGTRFACATKPLLAGLLSSVRVTDSATGKEVFSLRGGHLGAVLAASYSPDGRRLATASSDAVCLWDDEGRRTHTLSLGKVAANPTTVSVAFRPDGAWVAAGSANGLAVWEVATGREVHRLTDKYIWGLFFSPDGQRLSAFVQTEGLCTWGVSGELLGSSVKPLRSAPTISPDGRLYASAASGVRDLPLRDVATGEVVHVLRGHAGEPILAAFSPDGRRLAVADADRTVKLWDVGTGRQVMTLRCPAVGFRSVAFSSDGRLLGVADKSGVVFLFDGTPAAQ